MNTELIVFTHNDLDALGCMLNIEYRMPSIHKKYFYTNYNNISKKVDEIEEYIKDRTDIHILIPDVSFSTGKDELRRLYNLGKCTVIDHHLYPDEFWDEFPNMKVIHSTEKSATLLCNEYFGNTGKNINLDKLTALIDIYDLWKIKNPHFNSAQDLNEYFWKYDIEYLCNEIIQNEYKLPKNFLSLIDTIHTNYNAALEKFEKRNLIHRSGELTICFVDEWFNQILIKEMKEGKNFVICANSRGIIKIRINESAPYSVDVKNKIRIDLIGTSYIGHMNAFSYKMKNPISFDNLMEEIEKVVKIIKENCNE
jgi:oligoribonuclease NrnB/cAMP/cGMP phosphodiesterase (DHH superfamily)